MVSISFPQSKTLSSPSPALVGSSQAFSLSQRHVHRLTCGGQVIRIVSGQAWITFNQEDRILTEGEQIHLPQAGHTAVLSNLGREKLVYFIQIK